MSSTLQENQLQIIDKDNFPMDEYCVSLLKKGRTYFDILLYNCYDPSNNTVNVASLNDAVDNMLGIYEKLFDFCLTLSAFEYVGIFLQTTGGDIALDMQVAYFIMSFCFLISMFGALLCFIVIEYLRGCRNENPDFIVVGIKQYTPIFKCADIVMYGNCICFVIPINILIYTNIGFPYGVSYNVITFILFCIGIITHFNIIISKQLYNNKKYGRKIYLQ